MGHRGFITVCIGIPGWELLRGHPVLLFFVFFSFSFFYHFSPALHAEFAYTRSFYLGIGISSMGLFLGRRSPVVFQSSYFMAFNLITIHSSEFKQKTSNFPFLSTIGPFKPWG